MIDESLFDGIGGGLILVGAAFAGMLFFAWLTLFLFEKTTKYFPKLTVLFAAIYAPPKIRLILASVVLFSLTYCAVSTCLTGFIMPLDKSEELTTPHCTLAISWALGVLLGFTLLIREEFGEELSVGGAAS